MTISEDEQIDAKLEEIDRLLAELQKRRQELLEAKETSRASLAYPARPIAPEPKVRKAEKPPAAAPAGSHPPESSETLFSTAKLERTLSSLPWKSFKKKEGEWTFLRDQNGNLVETLESVTDFVDKLRKGNDIIVGKYRYRISEDRFLNRYFAGT